MASSLTVNERCTELVSAAEELLASVRRLEASGGAEYRISLALIRHQASAVGSRVHLLSELESVHDASRASSTSLTSLPIELVALVTQYLDQGDLSSLCLTCRYVSSVAQKALYASPTLDGIWDGDSFRFACLSDPLKLTYLTSLVCLQWHKWQPWFDSIGLLPHLRSAWLSNTNEYKDVQYARVDLGSTLESLSNHPRLTSLSISRPTKGERDDLNSRPNLSHLINLHLEDFDPSDEAVDACKGFASRCPRTEALRITMESPLFEGSALNFIIGFVRLRAIRIVATLGNASISQIPEVLRRMRKVFLRLDKPWASIRWSIRRICFEACFPTSKIYTGRASKVGTGSFHCSRPSCSVICRF